MMVNMWHLSKFEHPILSTEEKLLIAIFGAPRTGDKELVETRCGLKVLGNQLRTYEQYVADKGANAEMWFPLCFVG